MEISISLDSKKVYEKDCRFNLKKVFNGLNFKKLLLVITLIVLFYNCMAVMNKAISVNGECSVDGFLNIVKECAVEALAVGTKTINDLTDNERKLFNTLERKISRGGLTNDAIREFRGIQKLMMEGKINIK